MKIIILIFVGVITFTLLSCKFNPNQDNKKEQLKPQQDSVVFKKKNVAVFTDVDKSGLEGRIFYYVEKDKNNEYYASRYPTAFGSGITNMKFTEKQIIDGYNFMESTVFIVKKIQKKSTYIRYVVSILDNPKSVDTFNFNKKGRFLIQTTRKGYKSIILIDSLKMRGVEVIDIDD